jgi:hypothetical protein
VRDVAFANISKDARIKSTVVDCTSPYFHQRLLSCSSRRALPDIDCVNIQK